jgi:hypothetical protein
MPPLTPKVPNCRDFVHRRAAQAERLIKPIGEPQWNRGSPGRPAHFCDPRQLCRPAERCAPTSGAVTHARSLHSIPEGAIGARLPFVIDAIVILPGLRRK